MSSRRLTKHKHLDRLTDSNKARLKKEINASGEVLDLLIEILQSRAGNLTDEMLSKTMYESSAYTHKMSDISGSMREVNSLIRLLQVTEEQP